MLFLTLCLFTAANFGDCKQLLAGSMEGACREGFHHIPTCFPECVPSENVCNGRADCSAAADEVSSLCGNLIFLPYGPDIDDDEEDINELLWYPFSEKNEDDSELRFIFYRQQVYNPIVMSNGLISFHSEVTSSEVQAFPRTAHPLLPVVAPLWTAFTDQNNGKLLHRITTDEVQLSWVREMIIRQNPALSDYQPSVAAIATWQNFVLPNGATITHQAILSSNGKASFAIFVYGDDGVDTINNLQDTKLIGFDAADTARGTTVLSSGFSSLQTLQPVNTFRIDGHCVTTAYPGEVCGLNSYAIGCDRNGLSATACRCYQDDNNTMENSTDAESLNVTTVSLKFNDTTQSYEADTSNPQDETDNDLNIASTICEANATFTCEEGSVPSICPGGGDDSPFLGCFPNSLLCNFVSDCPGGIDEMNCTASPFLEFGEGAGDAISPFGDDRTAFELSLNMPLVYFQMERTELFASTNGFISLGRKNKDDPHMPVPFPLPGPMPVPMIAPLWADLEVYSSGAVFSRVSSEPDTLNQVVKILTNLNPALSSYQPAQAVIVTWFEPSLYAGADGLPMIGTFQAILSTDGVITFAVFIYDKLELIDQIGSYQVGFNSGDNDKTTFLNVAGNQQAEYTGDLQVISGFRIDGSCVTSVLPGEVCGLNAVATECPETSPIATTCTCMEEGFQNNGTACIDVDECADLSVSELFCDENAQCVNTVGSYKCVCNDGYTGDGSSCNRVGGTTSIVVGVVVALVVIILLTVVVVVTVVLIYRKQVKQKQNEISKLSEASLSKTGNQYFQWKGMQVQSRYSGSMAESLIVNSCNLELGKTIGQGEFGIVYKALLRKSFTQAYSETVAVKTLKGFLSEEHVDDLLKECTKMQEFEHLNILRLIGVCLDGGPAPYIIMPFMTNGSLLSHLKENRDSLVVDPKISDHEELDAVDVQKKLLDMCIQVAKGMEYLASKRLIHRDLAARNCMIDSNFVIKVADFGLSESIETDKDYFRQNQEDTIKLPIKWLSIESISDGIFSEKTDVWAYGVTCWEVFSGGKTPYPGIHPLELPPKLESGYRMEKPLNTACSDAVYVLVTNCWDRNPELRPPFSDMVCQLSAMLGTMADYFDFSPSIKEQA